MKMCGRIGTGEYWVFIWHGKGKGPSVVGRNKGRGGGEDPAGSGALVIIALLYPAGSCPHRF